MTIYVLGASYVLHLKHLIRLADLISDLRARIDYTFGAVYAPLLKLMPLTLTAKTAYAYWGFFSESVAGNSELVIIQYKVRGVPPYASVLQTYYISTGSPRRRNSLDHGSNFHPCIRNILVHLDLQQKTVSPRMLRVSRH